MKNLLFQLILIVAFSGIAQDTTQLYVSPDGYQKILIQSKIDTLLIGISPNGKIDSKIKANPTNAYYTYDRYYTNGKKMWEISYFGFIQDGPSVFYNEQGKKIVTIHYAKGLAIDTISHSTTQTIFFGNYSYSSTVYGGVENEDGSSNVQEYTSVAIYNRMKLINYPIGDSKKPNSKLITTTDFNGNFMFIVPRKKANYGIFPDNFPDTLVTNGLAFPSSEMTMSGSNNWSLSQELRTESSTSFIQTWLKLVSIGYAP
jgi:hypothetical protein